MLDLVLAVATAGGVSVLPSMHAHVGPARAISKSSIDTTRLHNDSTSISVHGAYRDAGGTPRRGKAMPVIIHGHSKDHRPDLKQLVWILTVSGRGRPDHLSSG